ncbi:hypothetical protein PILCRDRAFT_725491 [Piloderma croceum F 1598]|uniref:Aromatic prenyltransferase n=1 Tax=Piloderma croceum (strain F 1598) TaxID=765440 RepID=A0A0C3B8E0_PILCF|nr:hypothetical protein PILCRDRAFT_725491 [Piloderma croceum F 1598]
MLRLLLERSLYPSNTSRKYAYFETAYLIPLCGLCPHEFETTGPSSYVGDDGTPIEFSWVIESEDKMTVRCIIEPISSFGTVAPSSTWMSFLLSLRIFSDHETFDIAWAQTCFNYLAYNSVLYGNTSQHSSQFIVGADCTHNDDIVGKAYFLPHIRSQATGISIDKLVTECMKALGLEDPWAMVIRYLATLPEHCQTKTEIVAVDCLQPSKNRAKVYVRTQASSLRSIIDLMSLGGELSDPSILSAIATVRHLWRLLFSEADESVSIPCLRPGHFGSGFSVYFEMGLSRSTPSTKAYIPIRHYCRDDAVIAQAMAQYYRDIGLSSVGDRYISDIQRLCPHRDLSARTGVQTYIGCAAKKGGSQVSVYLSPESFAPERRLKTTPEKIENIENTGRS